jgi:citronellol/citronellal dehydrogenase
MGYRSVFRDGLFAGRHVVVTGGGSGIGRCTAHELAALGAQVALIGRKAERLVAVAGEIADAGCLRPTTHPCDIRVEEEVQRTVAAILDTHPRIDGLVNNAGGQFWAPLTQISQKGWETVVRTNLTGGFLVARECLVRSMDRHGGAIVNIIADMWHSMPGMGHSGAARAGMVNFTETAALEWSGANVRVNAVAPGWIASSGMDKYPPAMRDHIRNLKDLSPMGRIGTESEVSAAIVFLLSDAAAFISGATLRVDGAVPTTRPSRPLPKHKHPAPAFDGFPLAETPKVLRD